MSRASPPISSHVAQHAGSGVTLHTTLPCCHEPADDSPNRPCVGHNRRTGVCVRAIHFVRAPCRRPHRWSGDRLEHGQRHWWRARHAVPHQRCRGARFFELTAANGRLDGRRALCLSRSQCRTLHDQRGQGSATSRAASALDGLGGDTSRSNWPTTRDSTRPRLLSGSLLRYRDGSLTMAASRSWAHGCARCAGNRRAAASSVASGLPPRTTGASIASLGSRQEIISFLSASSLMGIPFSIRQPSIVPRRHPNRPRS